MLKTFIKTRKYYGQIIIILEENTWKRTIKWKKNSHTPVVVDSYQKHDFTMQLTLRFGRIQFVLFIIKRVKVRNTRKNLEEKKYSIRHFWWTCRYGVFWWNLIALFVYWNATHGQYAHYKMHNLHWYSTFWTNCQWMNKL